MSSRCEHRRLELGAERDRDDERERGALPAHLMLVGPAGRAPIDVRAHLTADGNHAARARHSLPHLRAGALPRRARAHQPLPRLEDQRLDLVGSQVEHACDLRVRVVPELEQHERGALIVRQPLDILNELPQLLTARDQARRAVELRTLDDDRVAADELAVGAQLREATVAGDRVQPWAQRVGAPAAAERLVRRGECQLQRVLSPFATSQHVHAEAEQAGPVPVDNLLERAVVARANERDELLVVRARAPM